MEALIVRYFLGKRFIKEEEDSLNFFRKEGQPEPDKVSVLSSVNEQEKAQGNKVLSDSQAGAEFLSSKKATRVHKEETSGLYDPNSENLRVTIKKTGTIAYTSSSSLTSSRDFLKPTVKGLELLTETINKEISGNSPYSFRALDSRSYTVLTAWLSFLTELPVTVDEGIKIYGDMSRELVNAVVDRHRAKEQKSLLFSASGKIVDPIEDLKVTGDLPSEDLPPLGLAIDALLKVPFSRRGTAEPRVSVLVNLIDRESVKKLSKEDDLEEFLNDYFVDVERNKGIDKLLYALASLEKHARNKVSSQEDLMGKLLELHSISPETKETMPVSGLEESFEKEVELIDQAGARLHKVLEDYANQALKEYLERKEDKKRKELTQRAEMLKRELSEYFK